VIVRVTIFLDYQNDGNPMGRRLFSQWIGDALFRNQDKEELQKLKSIASESEIMEWEGQRYFTF
jgi:hypothetical protein